MSEPKSVNNEAIGRIARTLEYVVDNPALTPPSDRTKQFWGGIRDLNTIRAALAKRTVPDYIIDSLRERMISLPHTSSEWVRLNRWLNEKEEK